MATFSERYGYEPVRAALGQFESMDRSLRVAIWDFLYVNYLTDRSTDYGRNTRLFRTIVSRFKRIPVDEIGQFANLNEVKEIYFSAEWNEVYDFLELCIDSRPADSYFTARAIESLNVVLEQEGSAGRVINGFVVRMSNAEEANEVEAATSNEHIRKAIGLLANRENPDPENVIKEAVMAVEYEVREATGEDVVRGLEKLALHSQLAQAWKNMYHWASQEPGVRHPNTGEPRVGMAEARYVLVTASAFVNYLKLKTQQ